MDQINVKPTRFRRKTFFFLSIFGSIIINLTFILLLNLYEVPDNPFKENSEGSVKKTLVVKFSDLSRLLLKKTESFFKKKKWKGRKLALSDLTINTSAINFKPGLKKGGIKKKIGRFGDSTGYEDFSVDGHNSVYHYINQTIKRHIGYPDAFVDRGIEGIVQGRLVFSPTGVYLPSLSKLRANNGRLKVHVARTLKELFRDPLPYNLNFNRHDFFMVDTTIRFVIRPYASREFNRWNSFSNGRHMAILIEKRGFNPYYDGNEWMDLLVTLMQYAPMAKGQPMTAEGVIVPVLKGFLTGDGPVKLKDGTVQVGMSTEEFLNFIQNIFAEKGMVNLKDIQKTYNQQINQLEETQNEKKEKMKYEDYKEDPEWDEWAEQ